MHLMDLPVYGAARDDLDVPQLVGGGWWVRVPPVWYSYVMVKAPLPFILAIHYSP
jgi:hypothetical protein